MLIDTTPTRESRLQSEKKKHEKKKSRRTKEAQDLETKRLTSPEGVYLEVGVKFYVIGPSWRETQAVILEALKDRCGETRGERGREGEMWWWCEEV